MKSLVIISLFFLASCQLSLDPGATVDNCDEICTVYHIARLEVMKYYDINFSNFPREAEYRKHVKGRNSQFRIQSYFKTIDDKKDTSRHRFSCTVKYDPKIIGYKIEKLQID